MFKSCTGLTSLNVSNFNTANVQSMQQMFYNCKLLTSLNVSSFNTLNVTDMSEMFFFCSSLSSISVTNFNTSKVTNMSCMFAYCSSLKSLNLSSFYTSKAENMSASCSGVFPAPNTVSPKPVLSLREKSSLANGISFTLFPICATSLPLGLHFDRNLRVLLEKIRGKAGHVTGAFRRRQHRLIHLRVTGGLYNPVP